MMKYLQKLGKALMLPVAALPICGILKGLGYALAPAAMGVAGETEGLCYTIGFILIKAGGALIDNMAWLFAVGAAVGLSDDRDGTAGLAGLVSYLVMTQLLTVTLPADTGFFTAEGEPGITAAAGVPLQVLRGLAENEVNMTAFSKIPNNAFIGILAAIIGSACYNKFKNTKLPDWLAFFSGKRCVAIVTGLVSVLVSVVLLFVWPLIFGALYALGEGIVSLGGLGAGLYAFFNRLLIPTGLHHALNNVFWFDTIGIGDLSNYWAGHVTGDVGTTGEVIDWSLGMYMSGFFPCMMFGVAGAALAMVHTAKNKKAAMGLVLSAAVCSFVCGVTEPFEFGFMFLCFPLYIVYALLYGVFAVITYYSGFRAGFMFSAGATDLAFSYALPAHANTWMILPLGLAAFLVFYLVFRFAITRFDLMTPGREESPAAPAVQAPAAAPGSDEAAGMAAAVLAAVGGKGNVVSVDYCATRLRFEIRDDAAVDDKAVKAAGAMAVVHPGKTTCQVVVGPKVQFVYDAMKKLL